jgi:hypothetical protein
LTRRNRSVGYNPPAQSFGGRAGAGGHR